MDKFLIFVLLFLFSCKKEQTNNNFCKNGSVFVTTGIIVEINTDSGSSDEVDYIVLRNNNKDSIYRNLVGNMYLSMKVGDKIINCQ